MSAQTKSRNSRSNKVKDTPDSSKNANTPARTQSIIRTRHQAVKDANPGVEIKRRTTPGVFYNYGTGESEDKPVRGKAGSKNKNSSGKEESEDDSTPKRGRPQKSKQTPNNTSLDKKPIASEKQDDKTGNSKGNGSVKKGRGRPPKISREEIGGSPENSLVVDDSSDDSGENDIRKEKETPQNNGDSVKRGRGRPKKILLIPSEQPQDSTSMPFEDSPDNSKQVILPTVSQSPESIPSPRKTPTILRKSLNIDTQAQSENSTCTPKLFEVTSLPDVVKIVGSPTKDAVDESDSKTKGSVDVVNASGNADTPEISSTTQEKVKRGRGRPRKQILFPEENKDNGETVKEMRTSTPEPHPGKKGGRRKEILESCDGEVSGPNEEIGIVGTEGIVNRKIPEQSKNDATDNVIVEEPKPSETQSKESVEEKMEVSMDENKVAEPANMPDDSVNLDSDAAQQNLLDIAKNLQQNLVTSSDRKLATTPTQVASDQKPLEKRDTSRPQDDRMDVDEAEVATKTSETTDSSVVTQASEEPGTMMLDILASACISQSQTVTSPITSTLSMSSPATPWVLTSKDQTSSIQQTMPKIEGQSPTKQLDEAVLISPETPKAQSTSSAEQPPIANLMTQTKEASFQAEQPKVDMISAMNASIEKEGENTWDLTKMVNLFLQWQNTDAMCWLDVVLSILAHSPTLKDRAKTWGTKQQVINKNSSNVNETKTCDSQDSMCNLDEVMSESLVAKDVSDDVSDCVAEMVTKICHADQDTSVAPMLVDVDPKDADPKLKETVELIKIPSDTMVCPSVPSTPVKEENKTKSKLKFPVIITLIKAHEQAQYLLQNFLTTPITKADSITKEGDTISQSSSNPQTGAGIKIISPLLTVLHKQPNGGLPMDALTHLGESLSKLDDVREVVWDILQPRLKCEKGKNDSPVFALPLLVRESQELKHMFSIEYSLVFHCSKCDYKQENKFVKALPSLPNVPSDFSMKQPAFIRSCFRCEEPGQKMLMKIHSMQDIAMLHFIQGLPRVIYDDLDFDFNGTRYSVTAVVQYKNNPDHFVSWIRNAKENQWMECDDLKSPLCQFENAPPRIPPEQIHIVMWEKNLSGKHGHNLENSRTAGLLSSLLMSTRMVTVTSEGNNRVLTTVPIQYTPVVGQVQPKRKPEEGTPLTAKPKISVYPMKTPARPNIISNRMSTNPVTVVPAQRCVTRDSAIANSDIIQKAIGDAKEVVASPGTAGKTKVVIFNSKQNPVLGEPVPQNEMKTVSIGGRIVKLTTQQLNAIRNSPGARVSIVGQDGTTTFSIKGIQEYKSPATSHTTTTSTSPVPENTNVESPVVEPKTDVTTAITSSPSSGLAVSQQSQDVESTPTMLAQNSLSPQQFSLSQQTVAATTSQDQTTPQTLLQSTAKSIIIQPATSTPRVVIPTVSSPASAQLSSSGLPNTSPTNPKSSNTASLLDSNIMVNPSRPCKIVVNSQGQVTGIASNNSPQIIPLTKDKAKNRVILQKFFSQFDKVENSNPGLAVVKSSSELQGLLTKPAVTSRNSTTALAPIQPSPAKTVVPGQPAVSSLETAMAVDSISSPSSKINTTQYQVKPASVIGPRGGRVRATGPGSRGGRGRGRGKGGRNIAQPYFNQTNIQPNVSTTLSGMQPQALQVQNSLSGRQIHSTPRKVAIPTNNGYILLDVPAGRNAMECLKDPGISKKLVKNLPTTNVVPSTQETTIATSFLTKSEEAGKPVVTNIYNSPVQISPSTPKTSIKSISVPSSQEDKIKDLIARHMSQNPNKPVIIQKIVKNVSGPVSLVQHRLDEKAQDNDVLSAALMESGVQDSSVVTGSHSLDALSEGVVTSDALSVSQSQSMDTLPQTINQSSSIEPAQQSHALDILMQGISGNPLTHSSVPVTSLDGSQAMSILTGGITSQEVTATHASGDESQAMSILTGGITPQVQSSQGLDILTQGLNPPPVSRSQALDILTQGISPRVQSTLQGQKKEKSVKEVDMSNLQSHLKTASVKIGQIGATSRKSPIIITPKPDSAQITMPGTKIYTIKSNGNNSSEIIATETISHGPTKILNSGIQSNRVKVISSSGQSMETLNPPQVITTMVTENKEVMINPPHSQVIKRKSTNQFDSGTPKKFKTSGSLISSLESKVIDSSPRSAQDLFSSIESGLTDVNDTPKVRTIYFDPTDGTSQYIIGSSESEYASGDLTVPVTSEGMPMESMVSSTDNNIFSKFGMTTLTETREAEVLQQLYDAVSSGAITSETLSNPVDSILGNSTPLTLTGEGLTIGQIPVYTSTVDTMPTEQVAIGMETGSLTPEQDTMDMVAVTSTPGEIFVQSGMEAYGQGMESLEGQVVSGMEMAAMTTAQVAMTTGTETMVGTQILGDMVDGTSITNVAMGEGVETMVTDQVMSGTGVEAMVTSENLMDPNYVIAQPDNVVAMPVTEQYNQNFQSVVFEEEVVSVAENVEI